MAAKRGLGRGIKDLIPTGEQESAKKTASQEKVDRKKNSNKRGREDTSHNLHRTK